MIKNKLFSSIGALSVASVAGMAISVAPLSAKAEEGAAAVGEHAADAMHQAHEAASAAAEAAKPSHENEEAMTDDEHSCGSKSCEGKSGDSEGEAEAE